MHDLLLIIDYNFQHHRDPCNFVPVGNYDWWIGFWWHDNTEGQYMPICKRAICKGQKGNLANHYSLIIKNSWRYVQTLEVLLIVDLPWNFTCQVCWSVDWIADLSDWIVELPVVASANRVNALARRWLILRPYWVRLVCILAKEGTTTDGVFPKSAPLYWTV